MAPEGFDLKEMRSFVPVKIVAQLDTKSIVTSNRVIFFMRY
jgi:hypothetical protein